jgi:outer membrane protein OmpA-like peptidoglycan-associated protein
VLETIGPVPAFTDAIQARDVHRIAGLLAPDVRLSVPPLHYTRRGAQDVVTALAGLLGSFGALRYDLRNRYVAPGSVTDEVTLAGHLAAPAPGAGPGDQLSIVAARLIITHDAATVTGITVWPDLSALRTAAGGASRVIDLTTGGGASRVAGLTTGGGAGAMVATLRAGLPPARAKLIMGSARDDRLLPSTPGPPPDGLLLPSAADGGPLAGRAVPRAPVPRSVRRRRAALAGGTMLLLSAGLSVWVAVGALRLPASEDTRVAAISLPSAPGGSGSRAGAGAPGTGASGSRGGGTPEAAGDGSGPADALPAAGTLHLSLGERSIVLSTDEFFLFDVGKAELRPAAQARLARFAQDVRRQRRRGLVLVSGYTDSNGSREHNLLLSAHRAQSVAAVLRAGLKGTGMTVRAKGYGEQHPRAANTTEAGRQANRRVVVIFPKAG